MQISEIARIELLDGTYDKYDLEIADTHCFFANDILVHNCRVVALIDSEGDARFFSREGLEYTSLQIIADDIKFAGIKDCILDGECCIVDEDGNEDFKAVASQVKRKNHTVKNPMYLVFDKLTHDEFVNRKGTRPFSKRIEDMNLSILKDIKHIALVKQTKVTSQDHFQQLYQTALDNEWEGLVIRRDAGYEGKRSNDLVKVKPMQDAEFEVVNWAAGPFQHVVNGQQKTSNVLTQVYIRFKGNQVAVGSGFSFEERVRFASDPSLIVGKWITVQYFEESEDKDGKPSLRFPIFKGIRDYE